MGKPRQRAVDILGLQHQSGRRGSCASGCTSKESIVNGERPTAELPVKDFINSEWLLDRTDDARPHYIRLHSAPDVRDAVNRAVLSVGRSLLVCLCGHSRYPSAYLKAAKKRSAI